MRAHSEQALSSTVKQRRRRFTWDLRRSDYLLVLLTTGLLYAATAAPDILWQDSGLVTVRAIRGDIKGWLGLALSHPTYYLLIQPVVRLPIGEAAARVNLFSGLWAAVAVANVYLLVRWITQKRLAAVIGASVLAVSHTFWWHATAAEVYSLSLAGLTTELLILWRYLSSRRGTWLVLLSLVNGAGAANHLMACFAAPAYAIILLRDVIRRAVAPRWLVAAMCGFAAGVMPLFALFVGEWTSGQTLGQVMMSLLFGDRGRFEHVVLSWPPISTSLSRTAAFVGLSFPTPLVLLGLIGIWHVRSQRAVAGEMRLTLWWLLAAYFVFAARYLVPDQFVFFLWFDTLFAAYMGIGMAWLLSRSRRLAAYFGVLGALLPVGIYAAAPPIARRASVPLGVKRELPYRDSYDYFLRPWRARYHGARRFAIGAFDVVGPGGVILCDSTTAPVFAYIQQVNGLGHEITCQLPEPHVYFEHHVITQASIDAALQRGQVVAACSRDPQYVPHWLYERTPSETIRWRYRLEQRGPVFRIALKQEPE